MVATYPWSFAKSSDDTPRFYTRLNVWAAGRPRFCHPSSTRFLARSRTEQCIQSAPSARKPQRSLSRAEWGNKFRSWLSSGTLKGFSIGTHCDYYGRPFRFNRLVDLVVVHGNRFRKSMCRVAPTLIDLCCGDRSKLIVNLFQNLSNHRTTYRKEQTRRLVTLD